MPNFSIPIPKEKPVKKPPKKPVKSLKVSELKELKLSDFPPFLCGPMPGPFGLTAVTLHTMNGDIKMDWPVVQEVMTTLVGTSLDILGMTREKILPILLKRQHDALSKLKKSKSKVK